MTAVAGQSSVTVPCSTIVLTLPEVRHGTGLPPFCVEVRKSERGRRGCLAVADLVERLYEKVAVPFVFCCQWGAKGLVVPGEGGPYLACCRSPLTDFWNLGIIAKKLGRPFPEFQKLWQQLPVFGPEFVERVLAELLRKGVVLQDASGARCLGEAYGLYEVDAVMYETLYRMPAAGGNGVRALKVDFVASPKGRLVARVITHRLDECWGDSVTPIIGLVIEGESLDLGAPWNSKKAVARNQALTDALFHAELQQGWQLHSIYEGTGNHMWYGRISALCPRDAGVQDKYADPIRRRLVAALHLAGRTGRSRLLSELGENGQFKWEAFKQALLDFAGLRIHSGEPDGRPSMWCHALEDLALAVVPLSAGTVAARLDVVRSAVERILSGVEQFPILAPVPRPLEQMPPERRRELMRQDILTGSAKYSVIMSRVRVPSTLEDRAYDMGVVRQCMEENPRETTAAVVEALAGGKIRFHEQRGRAACREVIDWHRRYAPPEEMDSVIESFYKAGSDIHQDVLDLWSHAVGCFCAACTLGYVPALPIIRSIQRRVQHRYVDRTVYSD